MVRTWRAVRSVSATLLAGACLSACGGQTGLTPAPSPIPSTTASTTTPSSTSPTAQDFSGVYTLTITVPTRCNPTDLMSVPNRRYSAVLTQTGDSASVKLSGADFIVGGSPPRGAGFAGKGGQSGFDFVLDGSYDENGAFLHPDVAERLPDGRVIVIVGDVVAMPAPSGLSGFIYGGVIAFYPSGTQFPSSAAPIGDCTDLLVGFDLTR